MGVLHVEYGRGTGPPGSRCAGRGVRPEPITRHPQGPQLALTNQATQSVLTNPRATNRFARSRVLRAADGAWGLRDPKLSAPPTTCVNLSSNPPGHCALSVVYSPYRSLWVPSMTILVTQSVDASKYRGAVCSKHPDINGLRYKRNHYCVGCQRDQTRARRKSMVGYNERTVAAADRRLSISVAKKLEFQQNELVRLRCIEIQLKRGTPPADFRQYWVEAKQQLEAEGKLHK